MRRRTALLGLGLGLPLMRSGRPAPVLPRPDHIVIVVDENKLYSRMIGNPDAPYINALSARGAVFTNSHGLIHPSQPNYLALFSGSFQGVINNTAPAPGAPFSAPNLASGLIGAGLTFAGYCQGLPHPGYLGPVHENYRRRHNPWSNFANIPATCNLPFTDFPSPDRFDSLPTISFVIPDLIHDMHSGTIATGDEWLKNNLDAYIRWSETHNSLFILTFDESDVAESNQILTLFVGPMVKPGHYSQPVNHLHVLRTLEDLYGLPYVGDSAQVDPIVDVWVEPPPPAPPAEKDEESCGWLGIEWIAALTGAWWLFRRR